MFDRADLIIHTIELIIVVIIVPSVRQLVFTLVDLNRALALLSQQFESHQRAFEEHRQDDRAEFKDLRDTLADRRQWIRRHEDERDR